MVAIAGRERFCGQTPIVLNSFGDRYWKTQRVFCQYKFEKILDVGCGDGNFSVVLREACHAKEVHGLEVTSTGVESAKKNGVLAVQLDLDRSNFPYPENLFDAVFAGEVIEHLYDPDRFLGEIFRVLKPGGILVLTTPNLASIHNRIALLLGFQPFCMSASLRSNFGRIAEPASDNSLDHIRVMTLGSLRKLLEINRYKVIGVMGSGAHLPKSGFWRIAGAIDGLVTIFPGFAYRTVITCQK